MGAVVHRPGEGERLDVGPTSLILHATGDMTDGTMFLAESTIAPGFPGPPPHTHETLHDMFFILEGTLTFQIGDETIEAGPGTFVGAPPGPVHAFSNTSDTPVRMLNFNTPAGFENYMRDLAEASKGGPPTREEIGKIASKYDFKPA
jgi:mannose-6-phosphate isomerase-like protein (cupin superfamily)